jgi:sensor c-di-GMP phosphodiesterase-like protein
MNDNKKVTTLVVVCAASVAIALPILISLYLAHQESVAEQIRDMRQLTDDVLRRAEETKQQTEEALAKLRDLGTQDPCSAQNVTLMGHIAVASEYLQAVGFVSDDRLLCSSFGRYSPGILVGPPDYVGPNDLAIRTAITLPGVPDVKFILATRPSTGYSVIVHPKLPLDVFVDNQDLSVGVVGYSKMTPIDLRGIYDPNWIKALGNARAVEFFDHQHVVVVKRSEHGDFIAFAAVPAAHVESGVRRFAVVLVPLGVLAGAGLTFAMLRLLRLQAALPAVIRSALRRNEFFLEYQPVVDLRSETWTGAEALVRWRRSGDELMDPDAFIPAAEETGLIEMITERVIELVCQDAAGLFQRHPDFHIAINFSAADVQPLRLDTLMARLVEGTGGTPRNFVIEITERGLVKGAAVKTFLHSAREMGTGTAIDDFGTGYSSLSYLQTFDVDCLKIDKSFVDSIGTHAATSHVVSHIVQIAKGLGLKMVAEGVEMESQRLFLAARGVDFAQGWLFARPMLMSELKARLESRKVSSSPSKA